MDFYDIPKNLSLKTVLNIIQKNNIKNFKKANMDPLTDMYDVPFENMLEFSNLSGDDLYNLMLTNREIFSKVYNYLKRTNPEKIDDFWLKAAENSNKEIVKILIDYGVHVNK